MGKQHTVQRILSPCVPLVDISHRYGTAGSQAGAVPSINQSPHFTQFF